jgi:mRNA deadenylase 3'-5' endonuclease subunit Ccr4
VPFVVASYNVLAAAYAEPRFYPRVAPEMLEAGARRKRLVTRCASLGADVLCLQEVELAVFSMLDERLAAAGWRGDFAKKGGAKPDGCAIFVRAPLVLRESSAIAYTDGSGHIAQIANVEVDGIVVRIANTHLKWHAPDVKPEERLSAGQMRELLAASSGTAILCGDFNFEMTSEVYAAMRAAGFVDPHAASPAPTCNPNGRAKKIDYVVARGLVGAPLETPHVEDDTPLPSESEPSDHVPLRASFRMTHA